MAGNIKIPHAYERKKLSTSFQDVYDAFVSYLLNKNMNEVEVDVYASIAITDLQAGMDAERSAESILTKDFDKYFKKINHSNEVKAVKKRIRNEDFEKYSIASIWQVITVFIVLLFVKNWMLKEYLIHYSVDILVAIVAFFLALRNFVIKKAVIQKYDFPSYFIRLDVLTIALCFIVKLFVKNNFDITFLLLVLSYLILKRKIKPLFEVVV